MPYTADKPRLTPSTDELRRTIPGWGVDLDPADRPSVPKESFDLPPTGAHWNFPERQPELQPRERSVEHASLPPVFGTTAPLHGLSGVLRRLAYARYSEARSAHWLMLLAADRVDAQESHLRSMLTLRPDNPVTETGVLSELTEQGLRARIGRGRADTAHQWMDPVVVAGPWVLAGVIAARLGRRVLRSARASR
jgi:hypothetical protein